MPIQEFTAEILETVHGYASVTEDSFGQIYPTFQTYSQFWNSSSEITSGHIRWPGGSLAENKGGQDQYHLTNPEIHTHNVPEKGFSNILEQAMAENLGVAMILPTYDYYQERSTANFTSDLNVFFDRLTQEDGFYDQSLDFFETSLDLTLEIGNETAHMGFGSWSYGNLAYEALHTASQNAAIMGNDNIKFAVQSGGYNDTSGLFSTQLIINNLDGTSSNTTGGSTFSNQENVLEMIDTLVNHDGLVARAEDFDFQEEFLMLDEWKKAMGDHWDDVELYASAWGVGRHADGYDELLEGDPDKLSQYDVGARQGSGTLDVFAKMTALGYDSAALWGVADPNLNSSTYLQEGENATGTRFDWNASEFSHGGEVLKLMKESLAGMEMLEGNVDANGEWNATYYDWETKEGSGALNTYGFLDDSKFVVFASVTDLDGHRSTHDAAASTGVGTHVFDFSSLHAADHVTVHAVRTAFDDDGWADFKAQNPTLSGPDLQAFRRLFETPEVHTETIQIRSDGTFEYTFTDDFEVVRFVGEAAPSAPLGKAEDPLECLLPVGFQSAGSAQAFGQQETYKKPGEHEEDSCGDGPCDHSLVDRSLVNDPVLTLNTFEFAPATQTAMPGIEQENSCGDGACDCGDGPCEHSLENSPTFMNDTFEFSDTPAHHDHGHDHGHDHHHDLMFDLPLIEDVIEPKHVDVPVPPPMPTTELLDIPAKPELVMELDF